MRVAALLGLLVAACFTLAAPAPKERKVNTAGTLFLVQDTGLVYLGPDGKERERLSSNVTNGALSPDGRWLACLQYENEQRHSKLVIRPRVGKGTPIVVPDVSVATGEGCLPVWSADGGRLLIGQSRARTGGGLKNTFHVYDIAAKKLTSLPLPTSHWVSGWSKDGKRLLSTFRDTDVLRICWVNADGKGEPEFLTPASEAACHPVLSPDGRFILFKAWPGRRTQARLYAMNLATKKRVTLDEPGETHGHCWSADGSRVAYTWQPTPVKGSENSERVTRLFTCDADGKNRQEITSRKYKPAEPGLHVTIFFEVIAWR
jgi:Tol biopolymer transport system component